MPDLLSSVSLMLGNFCNKVFRKPLLPPFSCHLISSELYGTQAGIGATQTNNLSVLLNVKINYKLTTRLGQGWGQFNSELELNQHGWNWNWN